jgi:DNA-binding HxlR family transcriptional regulator
MPKQSRLPASCSVARTLEVVGEWWSMMIIREAFLGTKRFEDFQRYLGVSRNVLSARLAKLVAHGVLTKTPVSETSKRLQYRLTLKGRELWPVVIALMQWGDRHLPRADAPPLELFDRLDGSPVDAVVVRSEKGRRLEASDVKVRAAPETLALRERARSGG